MIIFRQHNFRFGQQCQHESFTKKFPEGIQCTKTIFDSCFANKHCLYHCDCVQSRNDVKQELEFRRILINNINK